MECQKCQKKVEVQNKGYHDTCFLCSLCSAPIGSSKCFIFNENFICNTCYENKIAKTCAICGNKIFENMLKSKNEYYHKNCIVCSFCGESLGGQSIVIQEGKRYCSRCYENFFAKKCHVCVQPISAGIQYIVFEDNCWHPDCFNCTKCRKSLKEEGFNMDTGNVVCMTCAG